MPHSLSMKSRISKEGVLDLFLTQEPLPVPGDDEVLIRVEAAPINPSDQGVLFGPADIARASAQTIDGLPCLRAPVPESLLPRLAARLDKALPVGNEGAGTVIAAGKSPAAQALMGKIVAVAGGALYAQHRVLAASACLPMASGITAAQAASGFVNPMTALCMVETMKLEGHKALVHTAAASNLGQMLVKICKADDVPLVNIVRSPAQVKILKAIGAQHVVDCSAPDFLDALTQAVTETGATLAFDATGGGELAGQILTAMERAATARMADYSIYGSLEHKQVYLYGSLDMSPTTLNRAYGMQWAVGGWLLPPFLARLGREKGMQAVIALRARVAKEITTTFASHYTQEISLSQALDPLIVKAYYAKKTGEKYLILPQK